MKIVVPSRRWRRSTTSSSSPATAAAVDPDYLEWDLNEWDTFSLEAALALREAAGEGEVVAVTVGDEEAEEALLGCLAKGADRGVRIWDDGARGGRRTGRGARARRRRASARRPTSCSAACSPRTP